MLAFSMESRLEYLLARKIAKVARAIAESGVTKEFNRPCW